MCGTSGPKNSLSILSKSGVDEVGVVGDLGRGMGVGGGLVELDERGEPGLENGKVGASTLLLSWAASLPWRNFYQRGLHLTLSARGVISGEPSLRFSLLVART